MEYSFSKIISRCMSEKKKLKEEYKKCDIKTGNPKERKACRRAVSRENNRQSRKCRML